MSCGHSFTWMSVIPPTHCPICGACLNCGSPRGRRPARQPRLPLPWPNPLPNPYYPYGPFCTTTNETNVTNDNS